MIDPKQDPLRPGYFMNYATDETPAEQVLRKLACWLGVGGYNAPTVDADLFHRKIVAGIEMLVDDVRASRVERVEPAGLTEYDPNNRWGRHTYAVTLMQWDYSTVLEVEVGGNCRGFDALEAVVDILVDTFYKEQGERPTVILTRPTKTEGEDGSLICEHDDPDQDMEDWLRKMIVSVALLRFDPDRKPALPTTIQGGAAPTKDKP